MTITIAAESPLQDDVRKLIDMLNAHLLPLSPVEFQFKMTVEQMAGEDTLTFVARNGEGRAVGIGALKLHPNKLGEVKRMFTLPEVRGQRVGRRLLDVIVAAAERYDLKRLVLETGTGEGFAGAWRLYERYGFHKCGVVLDYPDSGHSAFFELFLEPAKADA